MHLYRNSLLHSPLFFSLLLLSFSMARSTSTLLVASAVCCCLMPLMASGARTVAEISGGKYVVQGRVFCDPCRAGFETPATTYITGAKVKVECRSRTTSAELSSYDGVTDETGTYKIWVSGEHEHEICESFLVESPDSACHQIFEGRERAQVFLTNNNGIDSEVRYANAMGFQKDAPLPFCAQLMKQYDEFDA